MAANQLKDTWFRLAGLPILALIAHTVFYNRNMSGAERFDFWEIYLLSLLEATALWEFNRQVIIYFRKKFPSLEATNRRIIYTLVFCTLVTLVVRTINIYIYDKTLLWGYHFPLEAYLHSFFVALLFVVIVAGIYESIYYFSKWKVMAVETEKLKKEALLTELNSLKAQINPHFLFNSLGSLSSLVDENPRKAQQFIGEMSIVYRYLLQGNEKVLTTLREEIRFARAYTSMLKTRFDEGLQLSIQTGKEYEEYLLPPLTLQLLIENAVKHNAVQPDKPLHVDIRTKVKPELTITNNLQPKTGPVPSNKTGLNNIATKYKLLHQPDISINKTEHQFVVTIPLINPRQYEDPDRGG
ncbi:histidine kinase [Flavihumibacter rivuli]|uniref:sensor histidine kinase n=1 Tax=Flavihumibacter rivuli TaxID=2838156 RepID=UPI001BDE6EDF|nr:histidine kinase [Flavihumibacter rivuli]ULQ56332.1 histidine kinase [Flavihumibacter rivuli]